MIISVSRFRLGTDYRISINTHYPPVILGAFVIEYRVYTGKYGVCPFFTSSKKAENKRTENGKIGNLIHNSEKNGN